MNYREGVSLIICTYNGAKRLTETISHVNKQVFDQEIQWEFLIIDNASVDNSEEVARKAWKLNIPFKIIREKEKGLIHARQRGILEATFEYISFIDDDNHIDPFWVSNIFSIFTSHPAVGMCGGFSTGVFDTKPPVWFSSFEGSYAIGKQGDKTGDITDSKGQLWGAGLSFRKSAYEKLVQSGFRSILTGRQGNKLLAGEDTELAFAFRLAGWRLWYSEELTLKHYIPEERFNWSYVKKMYKGFGYSHAVFEIYKLVLYGHPLYRSLFVLKIFKQFIPFFLWRISHWRSSYEGNKMELLYYFHLSKLTQAVTLLPKIRMMYDKIVKMKNKIGN